MENFPKVGWVTKTEVAFTQYLIYLSSSISNLLSTQVDYKLFQYISPVLCFLSPIWPSVILRIWALDRFLLSLIISTSPLHSFIIPYSLSGSFSVLPIKGQCVFLWSLTLVLSCSLFSQQNLAKKNCAPVLFWALRGLVLSVCAPANCWELHAWTEHWSQVSKEKYKNKLQAVSPTPITWSKWELSKSLLLYVAVLVEFVMQM